MISPKVIFMPLTTPKPTTSSKNSNQNSTFLLYTRKPQLSNTYSTIIDPNKITNPLQEPYMPSLVKDAQNTMLVRQKDQHQSESKKNTAISRQLNLILKRYFQKTTILVTCNTLRKPAMSQISRIQGYCVLKPTIIEGS